MLDIKKIRSNPDAYSAGLKNRGCTIDVFDVIKLDDNMRRLITEVDKNRALMNKIVQEISIADKAVKKEKIAEANDLKTSIKASEKALEVARNAFKTIMYKLPNIAFENVPVGKNEASNVVLRNVGQNKVFTFKPRHYLDIAKKLDLIDTERAAKISGSRFGYIKGDLVKVQFSLSGFVLKRLTDEKWLAKIAKKSKLNVSTKAFIPVMPPAMIRTEAYIAMGKLDPGQEEERYYLPKDNLYLIGSAEHTLGPYFMNETIKSKELPIRFLGYSTNFRREAGSYGKDTKGILRMHQFDKWEMFSFSHPGNSHNEHMFFLAIQEAMMQELKLPYRVVHICTGDMVTTDAEQFDIESWLPGQNGGRGEYRETHSTSNSTDYQARRLMTRYTDGKTTDFVHTINGTAFAMRTLVALIENYQTQDGQVEYPKALIK